MDPLVPKTELNALVNLLDEPDETAFSKVRDKIFYFGKEALPLLMHAREDVFNEKIQNRIDGIIHKIRFDDLVAEFTGWLNTGSSDLLKGYTIISRVGDPVLDEDEIILGVEKIRMDAWLELNDSLTALENVKVLNHILFHVHAFEGNKIHPLAIENFYLTSLMKSHKGSSVSLGILYLILAQKLNLPIVGVTLPQHFILAYVAESSMDKQTPDVEDVKFYINPFNKGSVFTKKEIELFISQMKIPTDITYFSPCSNIDTAYRLLESLIFIHNQHDNQEQAEDLGELKKIIDMI
jgi:regulator of sirC expression with transglutaminase-like and TPR domain